MTLGEHHFREPGYRLTASEFIKQVADAWGDRNLCVIEQDALTFEQAHTQSTELAKALLASGVQAGTHVGLLAPNGGDWIVAWLAAARIGAVVVLLNSYYKPRELNWVLEHSDVEVLLTVDSHLGNNYVERLESVVEGLDKATAGEISVASHPALRSVWMWGEHIPSWAGRVDDLVASAETTTDAELLAAETAVAPEDPMIVMYSSGSTGNPKGVVHSHAGVIGHPYNLLQFLDRQAGEVVYTPMPLFWVGGMTYVLIASMHAGTTIIFEHQFEPEATLKLIERHRVNHVVGWPHMAKALVEHPTAEHRDLSSVRSGSIEEFLPTHIRIDDPELRPNALGMTESLGPHSIEVMGGELPPEKRGSFGRSVPGVQHRIVDPASGTEQPLGEMGEIHIKGYSLMLGLLKTDAEDVFTSDGWFPTGDAGHLDADGHLYFKGRMGDQIKSSGMNITPREVEIVLEEQDEVTDAYVMGVPSQQRGQDVAAAVVLRPDESCEPTELQARVKLELSSYKVPRHIAVFRSPSELPWLDSGKIDLTALGRLLADRFGS